MTTGLIPRQVYEATYRGYGDAGRCWGVSQRVLSSDYGRCANLNGLLDKIHILFCELPSGVLVHSHVAGNQEMFLILVQGLRYDTSLR